MEAKPLPDYGGTDDYQVSLRFGAEIRDVPFLIYIRQEQQKRPLHHKLNVFQLIAIYNVCFGTKQEGAQDVIDGLVDEGLLLRSKSGKLSMGKEYKRIAKEMSGVKNGDGNGDVNGDVNATSGPVNGPVNGLVTSLKGSLKEVYLIVVNNPGIKIGQVAEARGKSESTVWKQLNSLRKMGLIEYRGSDKTGGYYPV